MHVLNFEIVRVDMTGYTLREFFVHRRVVGRFAMALLAARDLAMGRVTVGAGEPAVLGSICF